MIVSFNEIHGFDCKFQAVLSANLCHCVSPFASFLLGGSVSVDYICMIMIEDQRKKS
jgi:hypothetical protein